MTQVTGAPKNPFVREGHVDKAGIVGSHWWNKELAEATALRSRRAMITALAVSAAGIATLGAAAFALADDGKREERRSSLEMQRDFGWSFGATSETVAFDAAYTQAYARDALPKLVSDLAPANPALRPWYVPTLFQSPEALPRLSGPDTASVTRLAEALRPIRTPTMMTAENAGAALAELLTQADGRVAIVFDLDGPESVAAAAGAASYYDPVFLFDNWPHPLGVVWAHQTLAAAVYHQPRFAQTASTRKAGAPPAFVLDRRRLGVYTDDASQFDNRWLAKLPIAADLAKLEIKRVLYVVTTQVPPDDLRRVNPPIDERDVGYSMDEWARGKIDVRALALDAFGTAPDGKVQFGRSPEAHASFFGHYPWKAPAPKIVAVPSNEKTAAWKPTAPSPDIGDKTLGTIRVDVDEKTGQVVGPHALRSGSFNRSSGGSSGGWGIGG